MRDRDASETDCHYAAPLTMRGRGEQYQLATTMSIVDFQRQRRAGETPRCGVDQIVAFAMGFLDLEDDGPVLGSGFLIRIGHPLFSVVDFGSRYRYPISVPDFQDNPRCPRRPRSSRIRDTWPNSIVNTIAYAIGRAVVTARYFALRFRPIQILWASCVCRRVPTKHTRPSWRAGDDTADIANTVSPAMHHLASSPLVRFRLTFYTVVC